MLLFWYGKVAGGNAIAAKCLYQPCCEAYQYFSKYAVSVSQFPL